MTNIMEDTDCFDLPLFAQRVLNRIRETEIKGKKSQSKEALACLCGAAMAVDLIGYRKLGNWLSQIAFIVAVRGVDELETIANQTKEKKHVG